MKSKKIILAVFICILSISAIAISFFGQEKLNASQNQNNIIIEDIVNESKNIPEIENTPIIDSEISSSTQVTEEISTSTNYEQTETQPQ